MTIVQKSICPNRIERRSRDNTKKRVNSGTLTHLKHGVGAFVVVSPALPATADPAVHLRLHVVDAHVFVRACGKQYSAFYVTDRSVTN